MGKDYKIKNPDDLPKKKRTLQDAHLPQDGYYVLKGDVANPSPDRRSKSHDKLPVWEKATRFRIKTIASGDVRITMVGGSFNYNIPIIVDVLIPSLEPAPQTLGQIIDEYSIDADDLLAVLIDQKFVSVEQIRHAARVLYDLPEETDFTTHRKRHWLE